MKKPQFIIYPAFITLIFFILNGTQAQNTQQTPSNLPPVIQAQPFPGRIAGPLILNNGIVRPLVDLDLFQYSNLKESGGTSFNKRIQRNSNVEANKPRASRTKENSRVEKEKYVEESTQTQVEKPGYSFTASSPPEKTQIYAWIDEGGVKHFTNDIGSVPVEYRDRAIKVGGE